MATFKESLALHLFGPVLWYDLVRTSRRARYFAMRFFFALLLFLTLYVFYVQTLGSVTVERVARQKLIDFAEWFGYAYLVIQYLLVLLLTPAYVGSAIAEEKEKRTLEFLLATDLRPQEIIFGKLASRVGNLLMFLLAGLPVLAFIQFFGGLDPELLMYGFLATFVTVLSISAISLYCSVKAKHSRDGIVRSYLVVLGYFIFGGILAWIVGILISQYMATFMGGTSTRPPTIDDFDPITRALAYFTEYYLTGDIFHAGVVYFMTAKMGAFMGTTGSWTHVNLGTTLPELLRNYLIFHGAVALFFTVLSVLRLRPVFLFQAYGETHRRRRTALADGAGPVASPGNGTELPVVKKKRDKAVPRGWRKSLGDWPPMVWKELLVPKLSRRTLGARLWTGVLWAAYLVILVILFIMHYRYGRLQMSELPEPVNWYVRIAGSILMMLMVFGAGVRAAVSVGVEREKQTLETLLSTALTDRQILFGKWLGAAFGHGPSFILLLIIWSVGLWVSGLSVLALPLLLGAFIIYCGFAAALGLFFSAGGKTTTRSLMGTLFWLVIWAGAHWVFVGVFLIVTGLAGGGGGDSKEIGMFGLGNTPPWVLAYFAFHEASSIVDRGPFEEGFAYALMGLLFSGLMAVLFFALACQRFFLATGRVHTLDRRPFSPRPHPPEQAAA
jgi:ABC-type Na+ efflux pump permease subunit